MVNIATIALTHAIMLLAAWRLLARKDLERDPPREPRDDPRQPPQPGTRA